MLCLTPNGVTGISSRPRAGADGQAGRNAAAIRLERDAVSLPAAGF